MNDINGIIVLDKPLNYDSHQITSHIQKLLNAQKIGHGGTLDPKVTGILIILIGKATRLSVYFSNVKKEYVGIMHLHRDIEIKRLKETIKKFTGKIRQMPPSRSAVRRQERVREIYEFKILEKKGKDVLFRVKCESGTYIRKLCFDIGKELGIGAHMQELRRTKDNAFSEDDCVTTYDVVEAIKNNEIEKILHPVEIIAKNMPKIIVKDGCLKKLYNGSPVYREFILKKEKFKKNDFVSILTRRGKLIEIAAAILEGDAVAKPRTVLKS